MDALDVLLGAGITGAFYLLGRYREKTHRSPVKAVCQGCDHHRSFHTDPDGRGKSKCVKTTWCECLRYDGPVTVHDLVNEDYR